MFIVPFIEYGTKVFLHNVCFSKHVGNGTLSATTPVSPSTTGQTASVVAIEQRNIRKIKGKFSSLVTKSRTKLQSREISVEDVQTFLITMYSSPNSRDGSYMVTTVIESAGSLDEIFRALGKYGLWDYLNYYLLQSIIEEFASNDNELNGMMEQYQKDLTGHILTLKIQTHLDAVGEHSADENVPVSSPQHKHKLFKKLTVKVKANVADYSLNYVNDLWQSLTIQFALPQVAMILHEIAEGCIGITWLIPANLVEYVTRMAQKTSSVFAEKRILRVILEEQCLYPMETEPPLPEPSAPETEAAALKEKVCVIMSCIGIVCSKIEVEHLIRSLNKRSEYHSKLSKISPRKKVGAVVKFKFFLLYVLLMMQHHHTLLCQVSLCVSLTTATN